MFFSTQILLSSIFLNIIHPFIYVRSLGGIFDILCPLTLLLLASHLMLSPKSFLRSVHFNELQLHFPITSCSHLTAEYLLEKSLLIYTYSLDPSECPHCIQTIKICICIFHLFFYLRLLDNLVLLK